MLEGGNQFARSLRSAIEAIKGNCNKPPSPGKPPPACLPPNAEALVLAGFDKLLEIFGGQAGFLLEQLGLKDTVLQVLDSVAGAFADVESLTEQFKAIQLAGNDADANKLMEKYEGVAKGDYLKVLLAKAGPEADAALATFEAARVELRAKEALLFTALSTPALNAQTRAARQARILAAEKAVKSARAVADKAAELSIAKARRAASLDPQRGQIQMIVAGWETLSEAFMKLT